MKSSLTQDLQDLQKQAQVAQTVLENSQNELSVVRHEQQQLKGKIEAETEKLLALRDSELKALERKYDLSSLQVAQQALEVEISELANTIVGLKTTADGLKQTISANEELLNAQQASVQSTEELIVRLKAEEATLKQALVDLPKEIQNQKDQRSDLEMDIIALTQEFKELSAKMQTLEKDYIKKQTAKETELAIIEAKLLDVQQEIMQKNQEAEAVRKDLANRKLALDERESVLIRRERKVSMDEVQIQNNANLLQL